MKLWKWNIVASRWPWQPIGNRWDQKKGNRYGWKCLDGMGRFGGGWNFKLGIMVGGSTVIIDLIFGSIRISRINK